MKTFKKIAAWSAGIFILLFTILLVHIYVVTRPGKPDATTIAMARVDVKGTFSSPDADRYTRWFNSHKGIEYVLCNAKDNNIVFSFRPVMINADKVVQDFAHSFHLDATRYKPSKKEMMSGCPAAGNNNEGMAATLAGISR